MVQEVKRRWKEVIFFFLSVKDTVGTNTDQKLPKRENPQVNFYW